jgi:hypothetical protein
MITNLKKLTTSDSALVDPTLYKQLIGYFVYLVNTTLDICFAVNTLVGAMGSSKTCAQVFGGHNGVWSEISWRW